MDNKKVKGYAYGVIASVSYGLNPLFALPHHINGCDHAAADQFTDGRILIHDIILQRDDFNRAGPPAPAGLARRGSRHTGEPKILSCSTKDYYNKSRSPLQ